MSARIGVPGEQAATGDAGGDETAPMPPAQPAQPARPVRPARKRRADLSAAVAGQIEAILADAEAGRLDKARIDAVLSMIRMNAEAERLAPEKKKKKTMRSDDQLAATLRRIDERIVELALGLAERLGAARGPS
jgi:hypothetical protein